ncbi:PorV/PorQ family protein [soil metagenome]
MKLTGPFTTGLLICSLLLLLSLAPANAQVRKYSNEFLSIGVGARGMAMSGAQVASVNDVSAGYWNPAGLAQVTYNFQGSFMHAEYFAGIAKYDYGSIVIPMKDKKRFLGVSLIRFAVDDIPNTINLFESDGTINYDNIRSFSVGDYGTFISYAQSIPKLKGLRVGGSAKVVYRRAGDFATAWGFGLDLGAQYDIKKLKLGFMARDVTSTFNAWSFNFTDEEKEVLVATGNTLPSSSLEITTPKFILGAAYDISIKDKFHILPEINFEMTTDGKRNVPIRTNSVSIDPRFGLEMNYVNIIYVRCGVGNIQRVTDDIDGSPIITWQPNIGVGLHIKGVSIDYAFTDIGNQSDALYSHVFSLNIGINKRKDK